MSIQIIKPGLFDTIQDAGRYGYQHIGINPGGVMDEVAASVANMLVGNNMHEAIIELHFLAPVMRFEKACVIALSGANFSATINEQNIPLNTAIVVAAATQLSFKLYKKGARCYLAVYGGWEGNKWLNSYSTNTKVKAGGLNGRPLKKNDVIQFKAEQPTAELPDESFIITPIQINTDAFYNASNVIRCLEGRQYEWLDDASKNKIKTALFKIGIQSDRMGYRLTGDTLESTKQKQLLSSAVTRGTVQLLPGGELILLMADHQTTGGYPVIANAISADMPSLAQMQPGSSVQFNFISLAEAEALYMQQQQNLLQLRDACTLQFNKFFDR